MDENTKIFTKAVFWTMKDLWTKIKHFKYINNVKVPQRQFNSNVNLCLNRNIPKLFVVFFSPNNFQFIQQKENSHFLEEGER